MCRSTLSKTPNHSDFALNKQAALLEIKKLEGSRCGGGEPFRHRNCNLYYIMVWWGGDWAENVCWIKVFNTLKVILQRAFSRVLTTSNFIANKITEQTPLLQSFFYIGILEGLTLMPYLSMYWLSSALFKTLLTPAIKTYFGNGSSDYQHIIHQVFEQNSLFWASKKKCRGLFKKISVFKSSF